MLYFDQINLGWVGASSRHWQKCGGLLVNLWSVKYQFNHCYIRVVSDSSKNNMKTNLITIKVVQNVPIINLFICLHQILVWRQSQPMIWWKISTQNYSHFEIEKDFGILSIVNHLIIYSTDIPVFFGMLTVTLCTTWTQFMFLPNQPISKICP